MADQTASIAILLEDNAKLVSELKQMRDALKAFNEEAGKIGAQKIDIDTSSLDRAQKELKETEDASKKLAAEGKRLERDFVNALRALEKASARLDFDPRAASAQRLRASVEQAGRAFLEFGQRAPQALRLTGAELRQVEEATQRANQQWRRFEQEGRRVAAAARAAAEAEKRAAVEAKALAAAQRQAAAEAKKLEAEQRRVAAASEKAAAAQKRLEEAQRRSRAATLDIIGTFSNLRTVLAGLGFALVARRIARFIQAAVEIKRTFDGIEQTLKAVTETTEDYDRAQGLVLNTAKRLGLQIVGLGQDYANFLASTKPLSLSQREIEEAFVAVSEAGRVLNLSQQRLNLTFLALSQIASKGIATMEELRRQLGDQLPGVFPRVAAAMGLTTRALIDQIRAGNVLAEDVIPAITAAARDLAGGQVQEAAQTLAANLERLKLEAQLAQKAFIEAGEVGLAAFIEAMGETIATSGELIEKLGRFTGEQLAGFGQSILQNAEHLASWSDRLERAKGAFEGLINFFLETPGQLLEALGLGKLAADLEAAAGGADSLKERLLAATTDEAIVDGLLTLVAGAEDVKVSFEETWTSVEEGSVEATEAVVSAAEEAARAAGEVARSGQRAVLEITEATRRITQARRDADENLLEFVKKTGKSIAEAEKLTSKQRAEILQRLLREKVIAEGDAATDVVETFEFIVQGAEAAAARRVHTSETLQQRLAEIEASGIEDIEAVGQRAVEAARVAADQRLELSEGLAEKLKAAEQKLQEDLESIREEFQTRVGEGGDREEAERELQAKLLKLYEDFNSERVKIVKNALEEIEKAEKKRAEEAKKLADQLLKAEQDLIDLRREGLEEARKGFEELSDLFVGPEIDTGGDEIATLQKQLLELSFAETPDFSKIDAIRDRIFELKRAGTGAKESFEDLSRALQQDSAQALEKLNSIIGSEGFQANFAALDESTQSYVLSAIQGFRQAGEGAALNQQQIAQLEEMFSSFGLTVPRAFDAATGAIQGASGALGNTLDDLKTRTPDAVQKVEDLRDKLSGLAPAASEAATPLDQIDTAVSGIAAQGEAAGAGLGSIGAALTENQGSIESAGTSLGVISESMPSLASNVGILATDLPVILEKLKEAQDAETLSSVATDVKAIVEAAKGGSEDLVKLQAAVEALLKAGEENEKLKELATGLGAIASEENVRRMGELAEKLSAAATGLENMATGANKVTEALPKIEEAGTELVTFINDALLPALRKIVTDGTEAVVGGINELEIKLLEHTQVWRETTEVWLAQLELIAGSLREIGRLIDDNGTKLRKFKSDFDTATGPDLPNPISGAFGGQIPAPGSGGIAG